MGYLQLLMVENFKSWRGKQCIGPFKKFTCVIGPNGSGKSNVMDALSFVMGEKTSNLRVRHIQELIHGAHIGKPVSSTGSVKMVYMEENGEEKTFSRIIRGSGSEFLVNDKIVSRSVYTKELEEIGIIARARNCLVFQGEVETIAMKKPKERTLLFEQISHSGELAAEYAEKKKNMQQSEEEAQFSYNKKKNVAAERKRAKLEKEEAEHYQMMFDKLRECREKLQTFKLYHNEQKINLLNNKLAAKNKDIDSNKVAVSHAEDAVGAKKKVLGALNRKQQQIEKEIKSLEILLNQKRPQYIKAKERTSYQIKKVDTAKKDLRDHMKEQAKIEENKKELETELKDIDKAWKAYEKKVEEEALHQGRDVLLEESQVCKYKELKELVRRKVAVLTQQLEKLHLEQKADEDKMAFEQRKQREIEASVKQVMQQIEDHEKRIEKLTEYSSTCVESLAEKKQEEVTLTNEIERSKIRMTELNEELNKIVSDLHNAKIDVHEGKRQKTRAENLESLKRLYPGHVFGRLLDLCHPIHKKYQLAVTKVFGRYMVAIVVASEKVARDCIRFLKEQRAEAETFLPLDYIEVEPINEQLREIKGTKMMIDVIQTSFPALKKVIQFVCGNGLVCDTVNEARQTAFEGPYRLKTVALDGTLFLKSGVISGGSNDLKKKARYWDEKEVNELKEKREKLMNELKDLVKIKRKETDLKQLQAQCQGIQTRHKYSQNELEVLKKKHIANFYKVEDNVFREFCAEIGVDNIRVYEKEHLQEQEEIDKKRFQFENQKTRLSAQLEYICSLVDKAVKKNNTLKENICKDEAYIISLKKDEENFLQMVEEVMVELQQLKERWNVNKADIAEAQNQVEESRMASLTLTRELAKLQKEGIAIETSLEQKKLERHNTFLDCKLQDLKIGLLLGSLDDISEIELGSDTETTEMTADIYEREQAILVDYSNLAKELKDLRSDKDIETHLAQLQQEISSRENVLSKTAAPNMRALERLHVVIGRFQESVDVFETCRTEARICRQEFEKVKKRRYELFSQCFEHVSVAIDQIYKKLCRNNSAQAFLSPENPEEPYLEGIGYNCVAPGKRFMPMDNLSGGEKSIAALALVFAIHSFRPAPFFVLDEVDAALDNTNIGKISSFIKEQAQEKFQIIVISLKEEFYSEADALIGVWPEQEDTVFSQVLSLDLTLYRESDDENERQPKGRKSSALKYDIK
ncbi:structural maintenance of chromosomes protein 1B isoform X1 [Lacerta agilis]|uniref:structural maintenance of chromosomes protein 1B isoform X1 n=1 Tax=Lacerta agilis TaxID=80427 RepID=UPI001419D950|nr:structural maintenance of chromosomes protein 1B isoform X1 [Lacerta agilis]XP_033004161.1 structural maintenance of chromosomes protein 1B isoform X1 [Lacerta agilis]